MLAAAPRPAPKLQRHFYSLALSSHAPCLKTASDMDTNRLLAFVDDAGQAAALVARSSWERVLTAWLYVPFGITLVLAICFGIHCLISLSSVSFPASVACMIGLFLFLVLSQVTLGDRQTKKIVNLIEIPVTKSQVF